MPVESRWLVPNRVVITRFSGDIVIEDYLQARTDVVPLIEQGTPLVHIINDNRDVTSYPRSVNAIVDVLRGSKHPNTGWVVILTRNKVEGFLSSLITQMFVSNVRMVHKTTIEEALAFLRDRDSTLDLNTPSAIVEDRPSLQG